MLNRRTISMSAVLFAVAAVTLAAVSTLSAAGSGAPVSSFYELKTSYLDGKPADLGVYRGKVTLVVNVASKCGFTPQYEGLEKLHRELAPKGFAVLGFPEQRLRRPGAWHRAGDRAVLQAHLRRDVPDVREARHQARADTVADLSVPRNVRSSASLELQQVRHRQGRQDRRVLSERRHAGIARAARAIAKALAAQ